MKTLLQAIGYKLGKTAANAKSVFDLLGGGEEESLRAEIHLGQELAAATLEHTPLVQENTVTRFAREVGVWLAGHLAENRMPFVFRFTAESTLNAFALPGGHVFMSWPLLEVCQGQRDEFAFVLAHEMAHIKLRHTLDRIVQDSVFSLLLRQSPAKHAVAAWLGKVGQQTLSRAYSRESEMQADSFAVSLLKTCGGNPLGAERLLEKLAQREPNHNPAVWTEYMATHPPLRERIAHLRPGPTAPRFMAGEQVCREQGASPEPE